MRPTLSLCLIARDEAAMIGDCLASVADVVDQIVLVDTGSSDATPDIAAAAGATVVRHQWQGDFSAARNAALPAATGDWILILDADERLAPGAGRVLRQAITTGGFDLGFLPLHNAIRLDASAETVLSGKDRIGEAVLLPRLIRKTPDLAWKGVIHESVANWLSQGRRSSRVEADIIHFGNVESVMLSKDKTQRNLTLLRRAVVLNPDAPMSHAWLARELLRVNKPDEAMREAMLAWSATKAAIARGEHPSIILPASLLTFLMLERGEAKKALAIVNQAITMGGDHPNLDLLLATALDCTDKLPQAEQAARRCLERDSGLYTTEVMPGACSWAAMSLLGSIRLKQDDITDAIHWFRSALQDNPAHTHTRLGLADALLQSKQPDQVLAIIEPALNETPEAWTMAAAAALQLHDVSTAKDLQSRAKPGSRPDLFAQVEAQLSAYERIHAITGTAARPGQRAEVLIAVGEERFHAGDTPGALESFLAALLSEPGSVEGWQDLGAVLHALGERTAAEQAIRQCLALAPTSAEAMESLGHLLAEDRRLEEAADIFRQLSEHAPAASRAALIEMSIEGEEPSPAAEAPLLSVLVDATAGDPTALLDRLALQDLHEALFEVIVIGAPRAQSRPFALRHIPTPVGVPLEDGRRPARGRWILLLQDTDRPPPELLRRHLALLARSVTPTAIVGKSQAMGNSALVPSSDFPAPPSNISLPRVARVSLDIGGAELVHRLRNSGMRTIKSDVTVPFVLPNSLEGLCDLWEARGVGTRKAWLADPSLPIPLASDPSKPESWLGLRVLTEGLDDQPHGKLHTALNHGLLGIDRKPRPSLDGALTSVIIPNLNGFPHIKGCVHSLRRHTRGPVELIVVDNGSKDGSLEWLEEQPDVRVVPLGKNLGAPAARNYGLQIARGETIVFCDNDVVFTPRWRPLLLAHLQRWPDIGMVGPMSDYVTGQQKIDPLPVPGLDLDTYASAISNERAGQHTYTNRLILFFLIGRREMFDQIGGICESYGRWGFEDDDLSIRANLAGWQLRIAGDCFIRHIGSQTAKTANLNYDALLLKNWEVFKAKWGLPMDMPYGPYNPADIHAQSFTEEQLYVPYDKGLSTDTPLRLISMG